MKKILRISIATTLAVSSMSVFAAHDVQRERMGLEVMEMQVSKLLEQASAIKVYANPNAKVQFNYQEVERRLKQLELDIGAYLDAPLTPRAVPTFEE